MGKLTDALRKAAEERIERIDKVNHIKTRESFIVKKIKESRVDPRLVVYFDPKAVISEQYKTLRTNILSLNHEKAPKAIVITSAIHSEGKTITALNLALAMAQSANKPKVLLIDGDMRRGKIARYLGVENEAGLSNILQDKVPAADAMFHIDVDNLTFISAGSVPEHPSELLASEDMRLFIAKMRKEFDYVIVDTPPVISVTDAGIVGSITDGVVMVVQAGRTQRGMVKRGLELLHQAHAKLLGQVLTNIEYHLPEYIYRYL